MEKISIGIADDHALFRRGMMAMLASEKKLQFVIEANDGQDLVNLLKVKEEPDVILLDLRMTKLNGIETMHYLRQHHPEIKVIIISVHDDQDIIEHLFENGANAYLNKNSDPEEVISAINNVMVYDFHFNPAAKSALRGIEKRQRKSKIKSLDNNGLSKREIDVLKLI